MSEINQIEVLRNKKSEMRNALEIYEHSDHDNGGILKFGSIVFIMAAFAGVSPLPWFIDLALAGYGSNLIISQLQKYYHAYTNGFYILKPNTVIRDGRLTLETYAFSDVPDTFPEIFKRGKLHKRIEPLEFFNIYNKTIERYYSSGEGNLFRELVDSLILVPLQERLKADKIILKPTIADIYYSLKYDYQKRDDINNFTKGDYRTIVKTLVNSVSDASKEMIESFTGFDIDEFIKPQETGSINMPNAEVHKYISRLEHDVFSFFIPGFDTFETFSAEGACDEFETLGVNELLRNAYNSRIVLKYLGRFTDENELEFRRFVEIVDEAKKDLSDNGIICKVIEYYAIIEKKFENAEQLLVEYKRNPADFNTNDRELLELKLDSLIMQSKEGIDT